MRFRPIELAGLLAVMLACFTIPVTVAYNIGAIIAGYEATASEAGLVATAQGIGTAVGAFAAAYLIARFASRPIILVGLALLAIGNAASSQASGIPLLTVFQTVGGLGTGLVVSVVMSTAARSHNPEMTYGLINASFGAYIILLGFVMPPVIIGGGIEGAFLLYAAIAAFGLLAGLLAPNLMPRRDQNEPHENLLTANPDSSRFQKIGLMALVGLGIFFFAQSGMAAFIERIGVASNVNLTTIGQVFALGGLLTIAGPLVSGWIGARYGSTLPLMLVGICLLVVTYGLAILVSPISFYITAPLFTVLPAVLMPSFLGALAVLDPSGRSAGMQPAFATMGGAVSPVVSGFVVQETGFGGLGYFTIMVFIIGFGLMAMATLGADRKRSLNYAASEA